MSNPDYPPPLGDATPGAAANVPQSTPQPPVFNAANGITSTQEVLQNVLQVDSGPAGTNAQSGVQTFIGQTWAQGNVFVWE